MTTARIAACLVALAFWHTTETRADYNFPGIPKVAKAQAEADAKACAKKSSCFEAKLSGYTADARYWFEKALENLPADVRTEAWSRCKAMATSKSFDYVEAALGCQNVVSHIFLERKDDFKPVSKKDGHGSALMFAFATRIAQLSILARGCTDALSDCSSILEAGVKELPNLADLGDTSLLPYNPDEPPPSRPAISSKDLKGIVAAVKNCEKEVKKGTAAKDKSCDAPPAPPVPAPGEHDDGGGTAGDPTKPQFPVGFDFVGPPGTGGTGGNGNGNGNGGGGTGTGGDGRTVGFGKPGDKITLNRTGPRDAGGLSAALEARDQASGGVPNRLPGSVSAVRDAAASADAPDEGKAVFTLITDGSGTVTDVQVSGTGDWSKIIPMIKAAMEKNHARMMEGARGLKVTVVVDAAYRNPSGTKAGHKIGGPSVEQGTGAVNLMTFDVADIGASATRQVHAHLVDEQTLY